MLVFMKGLSILIPVYNADVSKLVHDLHRQALLLDCPFEIVLADDCSVEFWVPVVCAFSEVSC